MGLTTSIGGLVTTIAGGATQVIGGASAASNTIIEPTTQLAGGVAGGVTDAGEGILDNIPFLGGGGLGFFKIALIGGIVLGVILLFRRK